MSIRGALTRMERNAGQTNAAAKHWAGRPRAIVVASDGARPATWLCYRCRSGELAIDVACQRCGAMPPDVAAEA